MLALQMDFNHCVATMMACVMFLQAVGINVVQELLHLHLIMDGMLNLITEQFWQLSGSLDTKLDEIAKDTRLHVQQVRIGPQYEWFVKCTNGQWYANNLSVQQLSAMKELKFYREDIIDVHFGSSAWVVEYCAFGWNKRPRY